LATWVGIDGGGTGATAVALDDTGAVIARVTGGAALIDPLNPLGGAEDLAALAQQVLTEAGVTDRAAGLCCALAGAGRASVREALTAELVRQNVANRVRVIGDGEAALFDAFDGGAGVLLIAGTGSVAWARDAAGRSLRAGGWGMLLGDEGSGYALGMLALRYVVRGADGREKKTALWQLVLDAVGASAPEDLIAWTAAADKAAIGALAPVVTRAAAEDDSNALRILDRAAHELADQVRAVLGRSGPWEATVPIAFSGGLISPGRPLREGAWRALQALPYGFELRAEPVDPARGAARIAREGG
jgi:N-acetylglucosamine kinase-like BadF-type ATPase